jgi:hypothetical protein
MDKQKLKNAFRKAKKLEYTNGMATKSIDIKTDMGDISIIRKTNMRLGKFFLIRIKENKEIGHIEPNKHEIEANIKNISDLRGFDVNIKFKSHSNYYNEYKYSCILPVKIFSI